MKQTKQKTFYKYNSENPDEKAIEWIQNLSKVAEILEFRMIKKEVKGQWRISVKAKFRIF